MRGRIHLGRYAWLLLLALSQGLVYFFRRNTEAAEYYARSLRPWLLSPLRVVSNLVPFSVAQLLIVVVAVAVLAGLVTLIVRLIRGPRRLHALRVRLEALFAIAAIAYSLYLIFHAWGYDRLPLADQLGWKLEPQPPARLYEVARYLRDEAASLRLNLPSDEEGALRSREGEGITDELKRAYAGWEQLGEQCPVLAARPVRPKYVALSHYWSYTGITGMFMPLTGEANVNVDAPLDERLSSALHEIAHVVGYAREDEANALAFFAGRAHPDADYRYAAYLLAFSHASNRLASADRELWTELWQEVPAGMRADIARRNAYWKQFEGPVEEAATRVNDTVLRANRQTDGVRSYGRMIDLVIAWYAEELASPDA